MLSLRSAAVALSTALALSADCKPGAPQQVAVHLAKDPSSTLAVSWAVDPVDCTPGAAARVEYGATEDALTKTAPASAGGYTVGAYTSPALFNATISGLSARETVWYRVGDDTCGWSCPVNTTTAPAAGVPGVRLAIVGDIGTTANSVETLKDVLATHLLRPYAAALHVGDVSYADGNQTVWDEYGRLTQFVASTLAFQTQPGNHEWFDSRDASKTYDFLAYRSRFHVPNHGQTAADLYYSFDTGLMHVVLVAGYCPAMTSTSTQPCLGAGSAQLAWLEADLAAVDRAVTPWVIVAFHQPFVNSNTAHKIATEGKPMQDAIEGVLYANKVDVVFSGHVHAYERSCKVFNYECMPDAPLYLTVGDGGNREGLATTWVEPCPPWSVYRQATYGHGELTATNSSHLYWAWNQNEDLEPGYLDALWVVKGEQVEGAGTCTTGQPRLRARAPGA